MNIPGSNLLATALTLICPDTFEYFRYSGIQTNAIGFEVVSFAAPVMVAGSVQAVDRSVYQEQGLDWQRRYIRIWTTQDIDDLERDRAGDQIAWNGDRYQIVDQSDWHTQDGWNGCLFVEVPSP